MNEAVRRILIGKETGIVFGFLLIGSVLFQAGFLPTYLAVLLASGVRNVYLAWLGNGVLFWAVALVGLYLQAVTVACGYFAVRTVAVSLHGIPSGESSE
ncbi:MAG: hypothetical protein ABEH90_04855 [Halolamina sp.]